MFPKIKFDKHFLLKQLIHFVIASILYTGLFLILYFFAFNSKDLVLICDVFFSSGLILSGYAFLMIIGNSGIFDVTSYGLANMFSIIGPNKAKKYDDIIIYKDLKKEKRKSNAYNFFFYLVIGLISLTVSIILFFSI